MSVTVRSRCASGRVIVVEAKASRAGRPIAVGEVLRSARFSARRVRRLRASRFSARLRLRSARARPAVRATLRPRAGGRSISVRFRAAGCKARA